jgi:hypothetical protein
MEALLNGFAEGIALDDRGYVSEGSARTSSSCRRRRFDAAAFVVNSARHHRDSVIQICQELGITVKERTIQRAALYVADELFFSGTAAESRRFVQSTASRLATAAWSDHGEDSEGFFESPRASAGPGNWLTTLTNRKARHTMNNGFFDAAPITIHRLRQPHPENRVIRVIRVKSLLTDLTPSSYIQCGALSRSYSKPFRNPPVVSGYSWPKNRRFYSELRAVSRVRPPPEVGAFP